MAKVNAKTALNPGKFPIFVNNEEGEVREHFQEELSCRMEFLSTSNSSPKHGVWGRDEECAREKNSM